MILEELIESVKNLDVGSSKAFYTSVDGTVFYIKRPSKKVDKLKKDYDIETNLQIWAKEPGKDDFMPNHLRIFIDLELKRQARPELKQDLLLLFDSIFYGEDPVELYKHVKEIAFPKPLRPLDYDMYLEQLFLAEQTVSYTHKSKFDPKYLYLHGWVRCVLCGDMEIDRLCWSAIRGAPRVKYTREDNKKHRKYNPNRNKLWYLKDKV